MDPIYKFQPHRTMHLQGFDAYGAAAALWDASDTRFNVSGVSRDLADFAVLLLFQKDDPFRAPMVAWHLVAHLKLGPGERKKTAKAEIIHLRRPRAYKPADPTGRPKYRKRFAAVVRDLNGWYELAHGTTSEPVEYGDTFLSGPHR